MAGTHHGYPEKINELFSMSNYIYVYLNYFETPVKHIGTSQVEVQGHCITLGKAYHDGRRHGSLCLSTKVIAIIQHG